MRSLALEIITQEILVLLTDRRLNNRRKVEYIANELPSNIKPEDNLRYAAHKSIPERLATLKRQLSCDDLK